MGDTVDVTIRLKGDGWALQPDPIDAVLVVDRSRSMIYNITSDSGNNNERMKAAKNAAMMFVGQINSTPNRVGLVSFAKTTTIKNLSNSFNEVNGSLLALKPQETSTNIRLGIYEAIRMQNESTHEPDAIKAVIIMTDGNWNDDGTPIGRGTGYPADSAWAYEFKYDDSGNSMNYRYYENLGGTLVSGKKKYGRVDRNYTYCLDGGDTSQNMSVFANKCGVKLYTITFASNPKDWAQTGMSILATSTGGFYEHAPNDTKLMDIYKRIAGELKTEAGVDTKMDVVFENVEVNGNPTGSDVFDYVYNSTTIESWVQNENDKIPIIERHTRDDTPNWTTNKTLHFDIGTVRLNQTWETTFRLTVKEEGNINVFGSGSKITFNDGLFLDLPDTFITALPLNNTGMNFSVLEITNLTFTGTEPVDEYLPVAWDLNYTGLYDVTEDVFYSNDNEYTWVRFDALTATNQTTNGTSALDVRGLPPGEYIIRVRGSAPDTADAFAKIVQYVTAGATGDAYIRIK